MYSPVHASAGLLIAQVMPNPIVAFAAGIASHYVLDAIPHGDSKLGNWFLEKNTAKRLGLTEVVDLGIAILIIWFLVSQINVSETQLIAGAIGGVLPDIMWGLLFILKKLQALPWLLARLEFHQRWHTWIHAKASDDIPLVAGLSYQVVLLIGLLGLYL